MAEANQQSGSRITCRRRVELRRIENEDARHVCFSKRRAGLFRKASELSTLCGADIAIIVNSPTGRPYSFGSPVLDPVINRFLSITPNHPPRNPNYQVGLINHLNEELMALKTQLDTQLVKKTLLNQRLKAASDRSRECEWLEKIEELNYEELIQLFETLCQTRSRAISIQYDLFNNPNHLVNEPVIPRNIAINPNLVSGLEQVNPIYIPNPSLNNMIVRYQPDLNSLNQLGGSVQNSSNINYNSRTPLCPMLIRFNQFNSDLLGSSQVNIGSSRFNPSSTGINIDANNLVLNTNSRSPNNLSV